MVMISVYVCNPARKKNASASGLALFKQIKTEPSYYKQRTFLKQRRLIR
jgi:hypothetical protein